MNNIGPIGEEEDKAHDENTFDENVLWSELIPMELYDGLQHESNIWNGDGDEFETDDEAIEEYVEEVVEEAGERLEREKGLLVHRRGDLRVPERRGRHEVVPHHGQLRGGGSGPGTPQSNGLIGEHVSVEEEAPSGGMSGT